MYFKKWMAALLAIVALVACGSPTVQPVARVDNVTLSQEEFNQRVQRIQQGLTANPQQQGQATPSQSEIEQRVVDLFVTQNLTLSVAKQRGISVSDKEIDDRVAQFRSQFSSSSASGGGPNFDEIVQQQLGLPSGDSSEFRQFTSFVLAQQKLAETLVTSDTIRAQVEQTVQQQASQKVREFHAAHILFAAGNPQSGTPATDAEFAAALEKATKAEDRLKQGEDFATLAKELSDDPGSKDKGGEYDWTKEGSFVPEYEQAVFGDLKPGEYTTTPVKSQFGYHIIKLLEPIREVPAMTEEEAKQAVEQQVDAQLNQERGAALTKLIDEEKAKAKADGRLVEPEYASPTAEPAPGAPNTAPTTPAEAAPTAAP